jgi:hypothetical protein
MPAGTSLSAFTVIVTCTHRTDPGPNGATHLALSSTLTTGSASVSGIADTSVLVIGMPVWGTGIPFGTTIASIDTATTLTLSKVASITGASNLTYYSLLDQWEVKATACNKAAPCSNDANDPEYVQRILQVRF